MENEIRIYSAWKPSNSLLVRFYCLFGMLFVCLDIIFYFIRYSSHVGLLSYVATRIPIYIGLLIGLIIGLLLGNLIYRKIEKKKIILHDNFLEVEGRKQKTKYNYDKIERAASNFKYFGINLFLISDFGKIKKTKYKGYFFRASTFNTFNHLSEVQTEQLVEDINSKLQRKCQ